MIDLTELLADCDALGIRLYPAGDGGLTIDAPRAALTRDMVARMKSHKAELLALLRPEPPRPSRPPASRAARPVCRCGSTAWRDVPIHGGQSVRRDCARCGRFLAFPVWYGRLTNPPSEPTPEPRAAGYYGDPGMHQ